jgi:maltodextrin utilization protein YvdJ
MFISLATRLGLIRIYAKFRPNWRETDPTGDDLSEALRIIIPNPKQLVAQAIYDLKPEERIQQGIEEVKELDEEMTEHEWYRKNRDAILFVLGVGALILLLSLSIIFVLILDYFSL